MLLTIDYWLKIYYIQSHLQSGFLVQGNSEKRKARYNIFNKLIPNIEKHDKRKKSCVLHSQLPSLWQFIYLTGKSTQELTKMGKNGLYDK